MHREVGLAFIGRNRTFRVWLDVIAEHPRADRTPLREHSRAMFAYKMGFSRMIRLKGVDTKFNNGKATAILEKGL